MQKMGKILAALLLVVSLSSSKIYQVLWTHWLLLDIAVGAPYDGEGGQGAVYIFHGSDQGINPKPFQVATNINILYLLYLHL